MGECLENMTGIGDTGRGWERIELARKVGNRREEANPFSETHFHCKFGV